MLHWLHAETLHWPLHSLRFWLDVVLVLTLLALTNWLTRYKWLFILLMLPGTIAHELAHWLVAILFRGDPTLPSFWPHAEGRRWTLGHVVIRTPRWYNLPPIALAPLLLLPLAALIYLRWLPFYSLIYWQHWLGLYGIAMLLRSAIPSREDFRLLMRYKLSLLLISIVGAGLLIALYH